ncbi:inhibitor of apoptosis [Biomphalaria pfeifferi]|uniref:Inhibitor of apoptosis n=1 Tax=Biomphalaria pfeifferi TaxID=112525 RepID=A0AAD8AUU1_BIOPF|nr:inhibitor of apoptosis [Biomphalaria pfeifferi]
MRKRTIIPRDVQRKKSDREYNCSISTLKFKLPKNVKTLRPNAYSRFNHLQRKRKSGDLTEEKESIKTSHMRQQKQDKKEYVLTNKKEMYEKKGQIFNEESCKSKITSLWEDLLSLKHFRIRTESIQCYLVSQQVLPNRPTHLDGTEWAYFKYEMLRLRTFITYPTHTSQSSLVLAREGFVYVGTGSDDKVTCYTCCVSKTSWLEQEVVSEVHKTMSPSCAMVTGLNSDNIPIYMNNALSFDLIMSKLNANSSIIEMDAAPFASQECVAKANGNSLSENIEKHPSNNKRPVKEAISSNTSFATLEHASITMPPTVQLPPTSSQTSSPDLVYAVSSKEDNSTLQETNESSSLADNTERNSIGSANDAMEDTLSGRNTATAASNSSSIQADTTAAQTVTTGPKKPEAQKPATNITRNGKGPTYSELGIVTERPKRPEYAIKNERIKTFSNWPTSHFIQKEDLADAGFYYAAYGDCARCFFCGGGLRNWEDEDDVWVEHARWFPKCAFIRQLMGQNFVDAVQELNKTNDKISFQMVIETMDGSPAAFQLDSKSQPLKRDAAVRAMIEFGYKETQVLEVANHVKSQENVIMSADVLLKKLNEESETNPHLSSRQLRALRKSATEQDLESIRKMKERNNELRQQTMCKICMDKDVEVVFLPCGHLVSCAECAGALKDCAVCRKPVKGTVRAFLG